MTSLDLFADTPPAGDGPLDSPAPRWRTIAAQRPFLDDLAAGLLAALPEPEALADAVVLTPTRRGARALAEAFVGAAGGRALLLPQIRALGDLEEGEPPFEPGDLALDLPPAVSPLRRRFELARLVTEHAHLLRRSPDAAAALDLADALAAFLDGLQIEEVKDAAGAVDALVEGELAQRWRISADFLGVALRAWPARLDELGLSDVAARRTALLRALADRWREAPPASALIAAGSVGSAPAEADLLAVIASAPRGVVVLPGLDEGLADDAWDLVEEGHPQFALKRLLARAGVARGDVRDWPSPEDAVDAARGRARRRTVNEALRPAEATADWLALIGRLGADTIARGLDGLTVLAARNEEDAAAQAALLLREALDADETTTAALVTPDPALARRVSARLARWGVAADSSAGAPLLGFAAGGLLTLVARAAAEPLDPATLLAIAKHPLVRLGLGDLPRYGALRDFERRGLRGPRPAGWAALHARLEPRTHLSSPQEGEGAIAQALEAALAHAAAPFAAGAASAPAATRALAEALEMMAPGDDGRLGDLWGGAGGEAAASLVAGLIAEGESLPPATPSGFAQLIEGLVAREMVRTGGAQHPRLRILGLIEARLVRADRLVLAGLEEGSWPASAPIDPFLSRPLRAALGLPSPERRTGQAAHDFAQAACAPHVTLIHAERRGGQPAVKSRWLWRLETLARGAGAALPARLEVAAWARGLDAPLTPTPPELAPAPRPAPTPPVEARPDKLWVTQVETWVRDPYATYARFVLGLRPLDPPDAGVEAMARGSAIHAAFEKYATEEAHRHEDAGPRFEAMLLEALERAGTPPARMARERALARRLAAWVVAFERRRHADARLFVETQGEMTFPTARGSFTVAAKADRLEARPSGVTVLDFKSGAPPVVKQVRAGLAPQLTLTAAIVAAGGFADVGPARPDDLTYVRVTGRGAGGEETHVARGGGESEAMAAAALEGLKAMVDRFDDPATPYLSWAVPQFIGRRGGDYDHLARLWEWHVMGEGEDE